MQKMEKEHKKEGNKVVKALGEKNTNYRYVLYIILKWGKLY